VELQRARSEVAQDGTPELADIKRIRPAAPAGVILTTGPTRFNMPADATGDGRERFRRDCEFQRQSQGCVAFVGRAGKKVRALVQAGYDHLEIIETLGTPYAGSVAPALEQMRLAT
jgi:hypothetical protein